MVGTKCRISFLQYIPKNPTKFGIKLWALCETVTGYCLQFQVYTEKVKSGVEHKLSYRVVFDLMQFYLDKGYRLFMDNLILLTSYLLIFLNTKQVLVVLLEVTYLVSPSSCKVK